MLGHQITEFMLREDKTMFSKVYLDKIKAEKRATGILRVVHKNGSIIYNLYNNYLKEEEGKPPYIIGFSVLDISKIEAGKLSFESIGFEPKMVITNAMQVLSQKALEKGIQLTNSYFDTTTSKILIGDPYRLNQVMLNLIGNAIKFTEYGSVDISLKIITNNELTQVVQFDIKDSGIGMEEKFVRHLFDKFSQEYESVSRKYGGTGLGMSICKNLVELMGGKISAESIKGQGSCISFVLEFKKGIESDMAVKESIQFEKNFLLNKIILIVDDNDMNRLVASIIIKAYGATIIEAINGKDAVEKTISSKPDIILMDLQMPIMNGFEATTAIRAAEDNTPIIALTANAIKGENDKCFAVGMNDFISKPFKEEDLLKVISKWLGKELKTTTVITERNIEPTVQILNETLYNLSNLEAISNGNEAFIKKLLGIFYTQTPQLVVDIKQAYKDNDLEKVSALAHKIKPTIDNLGIISIIQLVKDIEATAKAKVNTDLHVMLQKFADTLEMVLQKMHEEHPDL